MLWGYIVVDLNIGNVRAVTLRGSVHRTIVLCNGRVLHVSGTPMRIEQSFISCFSMRALELEPMHSTVCSTVYSVFVEVPRYSDLL